MTLGSTLDRPLDDAESDRLSDLLDALPGPDAMSLEAMDGFFSARICAPCTVHDPDPSMRPEPISDEHGPRTIVREESKVGRNEPCPCGSGRKYKRCHGAA
jgi:hypothetical protein